MKPKTLGVSTSELVILAIHGLEEKHPQEIGFTQNEVAQFIADNYHVDSKNIKHSIQEALLRGSKFGVFSQKNGHYKLEDLPEPPSRAPESKNKKEKLGPLLVEANNDGVRRKRKKDSDENVTQWNFDREDDWNNYYVQLAKRRKSSKDDEKKSEDDDNMVGFSKRFV